MIRNGQNDLIARLRSGAYDTQTAAIAIEQALDLFERYFVPGGDDWEWEAEVRYWMNTYGDKK
jgi:hypothetical protein